MAGVATPEFGIFSVVFAALARMLAQKRTRDARQELEDARLREERAAAAVFHYTREAGGPGEPGAAGGDAGLRAIARNEEHEWRRWASADRWHWVPEVSPAAGRPATRGPAPPGPAPRLGHRGSRGPHPGARTRWVGS